MDSQKFGTFISELRKERGWTQLELAQLFSVACFFTVHEHLHPDCLFHILPAD